MKWFTAERVLPLFAALVSFAMTGLTVAAVIAQGRELAENQRDELVTAARSIAAERDQTVRRETDRLIRELMSARATSSHVAQLKSVASRPWIAALYQDAETGAVEFFPRPPSLFPESDPESAATDRSHDGTGAVDPVSAAARVAVAESLDRARFAMTSRDFRLAGTWFIEAAERMRQDEPERIEGVFNAYLASVDAALRDEDRSTAADRLLMLTALLDSASPLVAGSIEAALIRHRLNRLDGLDATGRIQAAISRLEQRSARRERLERLLRGYLRAPDAEVSTLALSHANQSGHIIAELSVVDESTGKRGNWILAAPRETLIAHYWNSVPGDWRLSSFLGAGRRAALTVLSPAFAGRGLFESEADLAKRLASERRRLWLLAAVTTATVLAWGTVVWLMIRMLGRQRELVHLQRRFMADVSHELKTPLALIRLHAETLAAGRVRDEQRIRSYFDTISRESERLTLLLDNILDFSRIEAGRKQFALRPCDVSEVARQAWTLFGPRFSAEGFATEVNIPPRVPAINGDEQALTQVIINLLQNAYRYSGKASYVGLTVVAQENEVHISVVDRGIGLSRSMVRRIGRSFERGSDPRVRRTRGTGLGLAIVKHIVAEHRGTLDVHSTLGEGSTFTVRLPQIATDETRDAGVPGPDGTPDPRSA